MDSTRAVYENDHAQTSAFNRGVVIKTSLLVVLPVFVLAAGCASQEPQQTVRSGAPYSQEIKPPLPRDSLLFGPDCIVR